MFSYTDYMSTPINYSGNPALSHKQGSDSTGVSSGGRSVQEIEPDEVLKHFQFSSEEKKSRIFSEAMSGAKKLARKSWKVGIVLGMEIGLASNLISGMIFPPTLLTLALSTATGMVIGAGVGAIAGAIAGALIRSAVSALYLAAKSPEQRLAYAARKGSNRLQKLQDKKEKGKSLKVEEQQEMSYLVWHVPLWDKAARHFAEKAEKARTRKFSCNSTLKNPEFATNTG